MAILIQDREAGRLIRTLAERIGDRQTFKKEAITNRPPWSGLSKLTKKSTVVHS
jgi:hypothetical protein